jgi:hypothetical protein
MTGEAIRTRRFARPIARAIRAERSSPFPGVNQARTGFPSTPIVRGSTKPLRSTAPVTQSSSKFAAYAAATSGERTTTTTFSWRANESSVQFIEPVQVASPSRTTYLWCMRSGTPATALFGTPKEAMSSASASGGGGTGIGFLWSTL